MKSLTQQIGIITWAIYFTLSISGINLQKLYCHCTDKAYVSLFEIEDNCSDHHEEEKVSKSSCCEKLLNKRSCTKETEQSESKDCCGSKSDLVKADIDVLYSSTIPMLPNISKTIVALPVFENFTFTKSLHTDTVPCYRPPPPKRYGTALRDFVQSYLC